MLFSVWFNHWSLQWLNQFFNLHITKLMPIYLSLPYWINYSIICYGQFQILTHWGWEMPFSRWHFQMSLMKMYELYKISPKCILKSPINNVLALVQIMAWCWASDKPLSEPMMVNLLMHICVTWPQWVNGSMACIICHSNGFVNCNIINTCVN